jgi:penicillin-binding protein 2
MWDGIRRSCDVYFYDLARRLDIEQIGAMARRFGLGAPSGIDLPGERDGLVPTREWKLANFSEPWQKGETLVTAIGQGFILATPLQLAVMAARIANGGFAVLPRLLRGAPDQPEKFPPLGLNPAHLRVVQQAMDAVTNDPRGTAYLARITEEHWEMAGKTGTSQVRRITAAERLSGVKENQDLPWRMRDHALFVGLAPVLRPRYCCAVVVEHGGGGSKAAAPIVRDVLIEAQRRNAAAAVPIAGRPGGEGLEG